MRSASVSRSSPFWILSPLIQSDVRSGAIEANRRPWNEHHHTEAGNRTCLARIDA
jgi:hypothetical protein